MPLRKVSYEHLEMQYMRQHNLLFGTDWMLVQQEDGSWTAQSKSTKNEISLIFLPDVEEPPQVHIAEACHNELCPHCGEHVDYCECVCADCGGFVGLNCRCEYEHDEHTDPRCLFDEDCECTDCEECQEGDEE